VEYRYVESRDAAEDLESRNRGMSAWNTRGAKTPGLRSLSAGDVLRLRATIRRSTGSANPVRLSMRFLLSTLAAATLVACASAGRHAADRGTLLPVEGNYAFTANLPDQQMRGSLRIAGNEILLEPASGNCRATDADSLAVRFACIGAGRAEQISILIHRQQPAERSAWSASYRVQRSRQHCSEYGVVAGQQVCIRSWTEYYDTTEGKRGKLSVRRG
jgi:hypothetical protein